MRKNIIASHTIHLKFHILMLFIMKTRRFWTGNFKIQEKKMFKRRLRRYRSIKKLSQNSFCNRNDKQLNSIKYRTIKSISKWEHTFTKQTTGLIFRKIRAQIQKFYLATKDTLQILMALRSSINFKQLNRQLNLINGSTPRKPNHI